MNIGEILSLSAENGNENDPYAVMKDSVVGQRLRHVLIMKVCLY